MKRLLIAAVLLLAAGCTPTAVSQLNSSTTSTSTQISTSTTNRGVGWVLPDPKLTPGAVSGTDVSQICPHVNPALEAARPTQAEKNQVYAEYGISSHTSGEYEIDHLTAIELFDNPNDIHNLWPEPNDHPKPGVLNSKDELENKLHSMVCGGQISLPDAQHAIASNWIDAYDKYVGGK